MPTKPRIHFVENMKRIRSLGSGSSEWESGHWWRVGKANAEALIGGDIYFHTSQSAPSYAGGTITGYRIERQGELRGRYVFTYRPSPEHVGVLAGSEGWSWRYKKLVL